MAKEIKQINDTTSDLPEGFKMTELGPLPEEWEVVRLGEVVKTTKGKKPKDLLDKFSSKAIPYLTADFFRTGVASKYVSLEKKDYIEVGKDDIIFIWDGSNAGDVFLGVEGALASTMIKIEPLINVDKRFLFFFLKTKFELFNSTTTGTTIPHVNKNIFENLLIPLPFLSEQKAIAHVLQTVQRAKEATEKVIQATQELKKSLMRHLFTYGPVSVDEVDKVQLKETEIGLVPRHWEVVRLGEVVDYHLGRTPPRKEKVYWENGTIPWVSIADMNNNPVITSTKEYITEEALSKIFKGKIVNKGTLLMSFKLTIGRTAILGVDATHNEAIISIHLKPHVDKMFLFYYLPTINYTNYVDKVVKGNTLNKAKIDNILIPLPPLSEQKAIVYVLQTVQRAIEAEKAKKQALEILFQSLLHHLMTGKLRAKNIILPKTKEMI